MYVVASKLIKQTDFHRFVVSQGGVAKIWTKLYLRAVVEYIITKFYSPSTRSF